MKKSRRWRMNYLKQLIKKKEKMIETADIGNNTCQLSTIETLQVAYNN